MALNWKNLTGIRRNLSMLIIQFLMPSFQCLLNFTCLGPDPYEIPIVIVNSDNPSILSNLFINNLNNVTFSITHYDTVNAAIEQVKNGFAWALIEFQANYTRTMQYSTMYNNEDDEYGKMPQIGLYLDTTNYVITNTIQKQLWLTFNHTMTIANELFNDVNSTGNPLQQNPFDFHIVHGVESPQMSEFMAPGWFQLSFLF